MAAKQTVAPGQKRFDCFSNHCKHKMTVAPPTSLHASGDARSQIES